MKKNTTLGGHLGTKACTFMSYQLIFLCGLCRLEPTSHKKNRCPYRGWVRSHWCSWLCTNQWHVTNLILGTTTWETLLTYRDAWNQCMESTTTTTYEYNKPRIFLPPFYILGSWFTLFQLGLHILNKMRCVQCLHILRTNMNMPLLECLWILNITS